MVREEQIKLCAASAACYTSLKVRYVPERIDDDYQSHLIVPRVKFGERFPDMMKKKWGLACTVIIFFCILQYN